MIKSIVLETAAITGTNIEVTFIAWTVAKADPVPIVIALWLIGTDYPHLGRWVCEIRIGADGVSRDVRYAHAPLAVSRAGPADVEVAVSRVIRIESHAKNTRTLALTDFERDIEKWRWVDRPRWQVDDLDR